MTQGCVALRHGDPGRHEDVYDPTEHGAHRPAECSAELEHSYSTSNGQTASGLSDPYVHPNDNAAGEGARLSVHLADQDEHALILVLSHQHEQDPTDHSLLHQLAGLGVVSCGVDTDQEHGGRRCRALLAV